MEHIRIHVDGNWTALQFSELFASVSSIYYRPFPPGQVELKWTSGSEPMEWTSDDAPLVWTTASDPNSDLKVTKIRFASPGFVDLAGLGAALREIRLFIQYLCERREKTNSMELENEEKRIRNEAMKAFVEDYKRNRKGEENIDTAAVPTALLDLIAQKKVRGADEGNEEKT